jgi:hypothetical protein
VNFSLPWSNIETGLEDVAEGRGEGVHPTVLDFLVAFGLVHGSARAPELTALGERYHFARFVTEDKAALTEVLSEMLRGQAVATAFCGALWGTGQATVAGAVKLLLRLQVAEETSARRWLDLMNRAGWIAYNRANPKIRVRYNPDELVPPDEAVERERTRGHVLAPDTGYGNLLALKELVGSARGVIRWYEPHMPAKVLEVLYREVGGNGVKEIRLLSGPANVDVAAKDDFKRFAKEMKAKRNVVAEWRVLSKKDAFLHHDRFFLADGLSRNLPPLNTILAGSTGEILPSELTVTQFDEWWAEGESLMAYNPPSP